MEAATSSRGPSILLGRRYKDISLSVIVVSFHVNFVVEIVICYDSRTNEWIHSTFYDTPNHLLEICHRNKNDANFSGLFAKRLLGNEFGNSPQFPPKRSVLMLRQKIARA
jgi:hypothetical protein